MKIKAFLSGVFDDCILTVCTRTHFHGNQIFNCIAPWSHCLETKSLTSIFGVTVPEMCAINYLAVTHAQGYMSNSDTGNDKMPNLGRPPKNTCDLFNAAHTRRLITINHTIDC